MFQRRAYKFVEQYTAKIVPYKKIYTCIIYVFYIKITYFAIHLHMHVKDKYFYLCILYAYIFVCIYSKYTKYFYT